MQQNNAKASIESKAIPPNAMITMIMTVGWYGEGEGGNDGGGGRTCGGRGGVIG